MPIISELGGNFDMGEFSNFPNSRRVLMTTFEDR